MESSPNLLFCRNEEQKKQKEQEKQLKKPRQEGSYRNISTIVTTKHKANGRRIVATFQTLSRQILRRVPRRQLEIVTTILKFVTTKVQEECQV